jgi:hypothetical protein
MRGIVLGKMDIIRLPLSFIYYGLYMYRASLTSQLLNKMVAAFCFLFFTRFTTVVTCPSCFKPSLRCEYPLNPPKTASRPIRGAGE